MKKFAFLVVLLSLIFSGTASAVAAPLEGKLPPGCVKWVTVQSGDNLSSLAVKYGLSTEGLKSLNGLTSDTIYPNQLLCLSIKGETTSGTVWNRMPQYSTGPCLASVYSKSRKAWYQVWVTGAKCLIPLANVEIQLNPAGTPTAAR